MPAANPLAVLETPPAEMREFADMLSLESLRAASDEVGAILQSAAWRFGYLNARDLGHDHAAAVKAANRALVAVRKEMGFAYPESGAIRV